MIGKIIKERRLHQGLTQEGLAAKLNVTPQAVSRWENEISYPDITLLPRISGALQISADELLEIGKSSEADARQEEAGGENLCQNDVDVIFGFKSCLDKANYGRKVLITDDSDFLRGVVAELLTSYGFEVSEVRGGKEALDRLSKENFDILLLDIAMPEMDGFEALEKIREAYPKLPVVMLSARSSASNVRRALTMGAAGFVAKPFNVEGLLEHIRQ